MICRNAHLLILFLFSFVNLVIFVHSFSPFAVGVKRYELSPLSLDLWNSVKLPETDPRLFSLNEAGELLVDVQTLKSTSLRENPTAPFNQELFDFTMQILTQSAQVELPHEQSCTDLGYWLHSYLYGSAVDIGEKSPKFIISSPIAVGFLPKYLKDILLMFAGNIKELEISRHLFASHAKIDLPFIILDLLPKMTNIKHLSISNFTRNVHISAMEYIFQTFNTFTALSDSYKDIAVLSIDSLDIHEPKIKSSVRIFFLLFASQLKKIEFKQVIKYSETEVSDLFDSLSFPDLTTFRFGAGPLTLYEKSALAQSVRQVELIHYSQSDFFFVEEGLNISLSRFHITKTLGQGGYGAVYEVSDNFTLSRYAMKMIKFRMSSSNQKIEEEMINHEFHRMMFLGRHPNIIKAQYLWFEYVPARPEVIAKTGNQTEKVAVLLMDLCQDCVELYRYLHGRNPPRNMIARPVMPIQEIACIAKQLVWTLKFIHDNGVIHSDLKTDNILIDQNTGKIYLIDFGLSTARPQPGEPLNNWRVGTMEYMAPEIFYGGFNEKVDIWALGIIIHELAHGERPFVDKEAKNQLEKHRNQNILPVSPLVSSARQSFLDQNIPEERANVVVKTLTNDRYFPSHRLPRYLVDFINVCLTFEMEKRPTADELVNHPLLNLCKAD